MVNAGVSQIENRAVIRTICEVAPDAFSEKRKSRGEKLSVLRTCVTKQTKDLRYIGRGTLMVSELWSYAR
jgi:hypothetical protein